MLNIFKNLFNKEFEKLTNIATVLFILTLILLFVFPRLCLLTVPFAIALMIKAKNKYPAEFEALKNSQQKKHVESWVKKFDVRNIQGVNFTYFEQKLKCCLTNSEISFSDFDKELLRIHYNEIKNLVVLEEIEQTQKNKSVVARVIIGGILLGGVGAIVGGISGVSPTLKTNKKYFLEIETSVPVKIIITTDNNSLKTIKKIIAENRKG